MLPNGVVYADLMFMPESYRGYTCGLVVGHTDVNAVATVVLKKKNEAFAALLNVIDLWLDLR